MTPDQIAKLPVELAELVRECFLKPDLNIRVSWHRVNTIAAAFLRVVEERDSLARQLFEPSPGLVNRLAQAERNEAAATDRAEKAEAELKQCCVCRFDGGKLLSECGFHARHRKREANTLGEALQRSDAKVAELESQLADATERIVSFENDECDDCHSTGRWFITCDGVRTEHECPTCIRGRDITINRLTAESAERQARIDELQSANDRIEESNDMLRTEARRLDDELAALRPERCALGLRLVEIVHEEAAKLTPPTEGEEKVKCPHCQREIDPTTCWCGEAMESHSMWSGHTAIPMGCDCYRAKPTPAKCEACGGTNEVWRASCGTPIAHPCPKCGTSRAGAKGE